MQLLMEYAHKKLVLKYDHYYIRFIGGQYEEEPCDIQITHEEAEKIMKSPEAMVDIFDDYRMRLSWNFETFFNPGIEDCLIFHEKYSKEEVSAIIERLNQHQQLKREMYDSIMYEDFPVNSAFEVKGKTAEMLSQENRLSIGKAYLKLLELAEQEKEKE